MAISAVVFHANEAAPEASEVRDMFRYHGIWAPGVRLFRRLQFRSKALIISAVFLLPILLLAAGFWSSMQQTVDFAVKERAGVAAMRSLVPVLEGVLKVRFATRSISGGFDANAERRQMWNDTDKAIAAFEQGLKNDGDPLGMLGAVSQLATDWRATAESLDARDGKGLSVFAPVSKTLVSLLDRVGDDSNLVLDPDVDSFYLVTGLVLTLPAAAEDLAGDDASEGRTERHAVLRHGVVEARHPRGLADHRRSRSGECGIRLRDEGRSHPRAAARHEAFLR